MIFYSRSAVAAGHFNFFFLKTKGSCELLADLFYFSLASITYAS